MAHEPHDSDAQFQAASQQLDALVRAFEEIPFPAVREMAFDLLGAVDTIHRTGLERLVTFLRASGHGVLLDRATEDPVIHTLLLLYDLIPSEELTVVEAALDAVRPYLHSHGGDVQVMGVTDGVVHLRLSGACEGCTGSATTLKRGVETALRDGYPAFKMMVVQEPEPPPQRPPNFIPLASVSVKPRNLRRPVFQLVASVDDVPPGTTQPYDVGGTPVLVANVSGEFYAVRDHCPKNVAPLHLGSFAAPIIICPCHNEAYDIRSGKRADTQDGQRLAVLPVAIANGMIQLAINTVPDSGPR